MNVIKTVGVVGAGQMGNGIAHVSALAGYDVLLADADLGAIDRGLKDVEQNLGRQVHRELITQAQAKTALAKIKKAPSVKALAAADLVIESAVEREDVKRQIFAELQAGLGPDTLPRPAIRPPSRSRAWPPAQTDRTNSSAFIS